MEHDHYMLYYVNDSNSWVLTIWWWPFFGVQVEMSSSKSIEITQFFRHIMKMIWNYFCHQPSKCFMHLVYWLWCVKLGIGTQMLLSPFRKYLKNSIGYHFHWYYSKSYQWFGRISCNRESFKKVILIWKKRTKLKYHLIFILKSRYFHSSPRWLTKDFLILWYSTIWTNSMMWIRNSLTAKNLTLQVFFGPKYL